MYYIPEDPHAFLVWGLFTSIPNSINTEMAELFWDAPLMFNLLATELILL